MKFKDCTDWAGAYRSLTVKDNDGDKLFIEVDKRKRVFIANGENSPLGVQLTRAKALKLAEAIIKELEPI